MKETYVKTLIVNLVVIVVIFLGFVIIDSHSRFHGVQQAAAQTTPVSSVPAATTTTTLYPANDYRNVPPFAWNVSHYNDLNLPNKETNSQTFTVEDKTYDLAFFSRQVAYYRFEVSQFVLRGDIDIRRFSVIVTKDGQAVSPYNAPTATLIWRKGDRPKEWIAYWFQGWKTPTGVYEADLYLDGEKIDRAPFKVIAREAAPFNRTFVLINLESNIPTYERHIFDSYNRKTNFTAGLLDWMNYGGIDGFMNLSGETTGFNNVTPEKPWEYYSVKNLEVIGQAAHDRGKTVGAYIMCFYTPKSGWIKAGYRPAKAYSANSNGIYTLYNSQFISFKDEKRFRDVVELAKYFNSLPYVDMIGFDFIRFGEHAGMENAAEFVRDMNVATPQDWSTMTEDQQSIWLGKYIRQGEKKANQWRVWQAHKTAEFIYRVRREAGLTKPAWAFTLSWDHGTHHGQDSYMMQDAGILADYVMLYEATPDMFEGLSTSWRTYTPAERLNYIPGNQFDAVLLKSLHGYNPVEEYYYRLTTAVDYAPYRSCGVFLHDSSRAFWGRRGGYPYNQWLESGFSAASYARYENGEIPFKMTIAASNISVGGRSVVPVPVRIEFVPEMLEKLQGKQLVIETDGHHFVQKIDISQKTNIILSVNVNPHQTGANYFAVKGMIDGYPAYFTFKYLNFQH